jgi:hypothetical protein
MSATSQQTGAQAVAAAAADLTQEQKRRKWISVAVVGAIAVVGLGVLWYHRRSKRSYPRGGNNSSLDEQVVQGLTNNQKLSNELLDKALKHSDQLKPLTKLKLALVSTTPLFMANSFH